MIIDDALAEGLLQCQQNALDRIMAELARQYPTVTLNVNTDIFNAGLGDSQAFFNMILVIEEQTKLLCDFESLDFDIPMTPQLLAQAFKAA
jgi:hypothetical protein